MFSYFYFSPPGLLFSFHLHGRSPLDQQLHRLLLLAVWSCAVLAAAEMAWPADVRAALVRIAAMATQGPT